MDSLDKVLENAIKWAKGAGEIQLNYFRSNELGIETKSNIMDVVTITDKACEKYIAEQIADTYPTNGLLGEETGAHDIESDWIWIVDPLDGTNNYSQGLPIFCVSIGLQYKGETLLGVVYAPYINELFYAIKGEGAYLNGELISVSKKEQLNESVLGTGFPYDKDCNPDNNTDNVSRLLPQLRGLRRMGAAAYDLCCVAAGFLDGYWEFNLQPWDVCAGNLIVKEAGGTILNFREDRGIAIVAGNSTLVAKIIPNLSVPEN